MANHADQEQHDLAHADLDTYADHQGKFAVWFVRLTEPLIFSHRYITLLVLILVTAFFGWQASNLQLGTGFNKQLPLQHPYIQTLQHYKKQFGTGNVLLVSVSAKKGDIYNANFLQSLQVATNGVNFTQGMDRTKVKSLWTPNVRYIKAVPGGFQGGNVIPPTFDPSQATQQKIDNIRQHVLLSGQIGRLVSDNQRAALVMGQLAEVDPRTGKTLDYIATGHHLEWIRNKITSPHEWDYVLKQDAPPFKAGLVVKKRYRDPATWFECIKHLGCATPVTARLITPNGSAVTRTFSADQVRLEKVDNPDYNANVNVEIIGFTKAVSDVADFSLQVIGFFILTIFLVWLLLSYYVGSLWVSILPLSCAVVAVCWEMGLLHLFGYELDPYAILVPFLVVAIAVSHGIQITNFWLLETADKGRDPFMASVATYRRLVIPGLTALVTNILGFATIMLVPIGIVQEMALNAVFGLMAVIVCKKILLPNLLTYVKLKNPKKFRDYQLRRDRKLDPIWEHFSHLTRKPIALTLLIIAALLTIGSIYKYQDLVMGAQHPGVQMLKPDGQYNTDSRFINNNYSIGVNVMQIYASTKSQGCIDPGIMHRIDNFAWYMDNVPGVVSTLSMPQADTLVWKKFNEDNPRWLQTPETSDGLVLASRKFSTTSGLLNDDCSVMPVYIYTADHKYKTINTIVAAIDKYKAQQSDADVQPLVSAADSYQSTLSGAAASDFQPVVDAIDKFKSTAWQQPASGFQTVTTAINQYQSKLVGNDPPADFQSVTAAASEFRSNLPLVSFQLAGGNVGVAAATNDVIESHDLTVLFWLFVTIGFTVLISFRGIVGMVAVLTPLILVSIYTYAIMVFLGLGETQATLPVVVFAAGIGVDYGIYTYSVLEENVLFKDMDVGPGYANALHQTGKAVVLTALTLAISVVTWLFAGLQFQINMGILLMIMFIANAVAALLLLPAFSAFLLPRLKRKKDWKSVMAKGALAK